MKASVRQAVKKVVVSFPAEKQDRWTLTLKRAPLAPRALSDLVVTSYVDHLTRLRGALEIRPVLVLPTRY